MDARVLGLADETVALDECSNGGSGSSSWSFLSCSIANGRNKPGRESRCLSQTDASLDNRTTRATGGYGKVSSELSYR